MFENFCGFYTIYYKTSDKWLKETNQQRIP